MTLNVGAWVSQIRRERKFDLKTLSTLAGIDMGTISRIENGKAQATFGTVIRICDALGITVEDLIQSWLREPFALYEPPSDRKKGTTLIFKDLESFILDAHTDIHASCIWLTSWFNRIAALQGEYPRIFVPENIEQLLSDSQVYRFEVQYPPDMGTEELLDILRQGGIITLSDVGAYLKKIRQQKQITSEKLEAVIQFSARGVARLETGSVERVKVADVLLLDEQLEQNGKVLAMYWSVWKFNEELARLLTCSDERFNTQKQDAIGQEAKLVPIFIIMCRWLQHVSQGDSSWLNDLRMKYQHLKALNS